MISKSILAILTIICLLGFKSFHPIDSTNSKTAADTITWSGAYKLKWGDFKGVPDDPRVYVKASTASGISMKKVRGRRDYHYIVTSFFVKSRSWTKVNDEKNLRHEQLHFDITELFSRKLRKSIDSLAAAGISDKITIHKLYDATYEKMNRYQNKYDNEVYFNDPKLDLWFKKIASELESLKEYSAG